MSTTVGKRAYVAPALLSSFLLLLVFAALSGTHLSSPPLFALPLFALSELKAQTR
jgi:hypothetical protein